MSWTQNPVLLGSNSYTPCKEIFHGVCDELGKHFSEKGIKYSSARPKLLLKDKAIKLEIGLWSSRSNIPGDYVLLNILPYFYSLELAKARKSKGLLLGHVALFSLPMPDLPKKTVRVKQIYGDALDRKEPRSKEGELLLNHSCNVYGIDEGKFQKIVEFIEEEILPWQKKLNSREGILELTEAPSLNRAKALLGRGTNVEFVEYVKYKFPEIPIRERLKR